MSSSIANLKENLNKIALDVHDDDDEDEEDLTIYGSTNGGGDFFDSDRRYSNGFRYSRSVSRSPMVNAVESPVNHEIERYKAEINKLQESEAEIKALSVNYAAPLREKEDQISRLNQENGSLKQNLTSTNAALKESRMDLSRASNNNTIKGNSDHSPNRSQKSPTNWKSRNQMYNGTASKQNGTENYSESHKKAKEFADMLEERTRSMASAQARELEKEREKSANLQMSLHGCGAEIAQFWGGFFWKRVSEMNPTNFQPPNPPFQWAPMLPPDSPRCGVFWNTKNITDQLNQLQDTLNLAKSMEKELETLRTIKDAQGSGVECLRYLEGMTMDLGLQEILSVEAANSLMSTLRAQLEPFRFVVDENSPWEEKSAAVRLTCKMKKSKRNKLWKKRKRRCVAEMRAKEPERFGQADREADEWREKEMAKDMANRKVDEMKTIEKVKARRERRRLEPELELALIVEELQELRSLRIEKLKKQGHFLPEEDDKFFESVRVAVEQEENQVQSLTSTETEENVIASEEDTTLTTGNKISKDSDKEGNTVAASCSITTTTEAPENCCDNISNLPVEFYHYYYGSNFDMGRLIEIRREWDAYLSPGGSRIPGHWIQPSPPTNEIWTSCLVNAPKRDLEYLFRPTPKKIM